MVLTAYNHPPVGSGDTYVTNEDTPLAIAAPGVLANDTDADSDLLSAILVQGPAHGTLTLNADGSLLYSPFANYNGADNFTYKSNDGMSNFGIVTVGLTVNAVNDAPVNSGPAAISAQGGVNVAISGLAVHDVDAGSLTTSLHVEHGTLNVAAVAGGAAVAGSGTSTVTLTGSATQIDAVLGAANNVLYHSAFDFTGLDHLTMTSNDGGSSGAGGALSDIDIFNITVAPQIAALELNGFARPALNLDSSGHIIFDAAVSEAASMYGTKFIFAGLPASTPTDFHLI